MHAGQEQVAVGRPIPDVEIERVALAGRAAPWQAAHEWPGGAAVNRVAVASEPLADRLQALDARRGDFAKRGGADVEQEIPALARDVAEVANQVIGAFP